MSGQPYLTFDDSVRPAGQCFRAKTPTMQPSNTVGHRVRDLASDGYGHEDIVVILTKSGLRISANGRERIKQIVLKHDGRSKQGAKSGR